MRILYLHEYFVPPSGSGGTRSYEMARRLVRDGHHVTMVTSSAYVTRGPHARGPISRREIDGISVTILDVPYSNELSYRERIQAFLKFALLASVQSLKAPRPDLVIATSTPLTIIIPAIVAKWFHRAPLLFEVRDLWPAVPIAIGALRNPVARCLAEALERFAYRSADTIVALSPGMKEGVCATGVAPEKVHVIPNICNTELFLVPPERGDAFRGRHPELKNRRIVSYAGALGYIHGVGYLVEMARTMYRLDPDVLFLIVGEGSEEASIRELAVRHGLLGRNVTMMRPIPKREIPDLLAASTIAASLCLDLPELRHNSANKFFDALAAGKPVMINYEGWQADLVRSSRAGIVVPADRPEIAAQMLRDLLVDAARLADAACAARRIATTSFSHQRLTDAFLALALATAGRRKGHRLTAADRISDSQQPSR